MYFALAYPFSCILTFNPSFKIAGEQEEHFCGFGWYFPSTVVNLSSSTDTISGDHFVLIYNEEGQPPVSHEYAGCNTQEGREEGQADTDILWGARAHELDDPSEPPQG